MNKSEITERAVRESIEVVNRCNNHRRKPCQVCEYALTKIVERAIAESQAPQHHVCCNGDRSKPPGTKGTSCSCAELGDGEPSPPPDASLDFEKLPVRIQAVKCLLREYADKPLVFKHTPDWLNDAIASGKIRPEFRSEDYWYYVIQTLEGEMAASPGDWIIRGVAGEIYPCKPEIFCKTYKPVESGAAQEVSPSANFISEIRPSEAYAAAVSKNLALMEKKFDNLMADSNTIIKQRESRILELEKEIAALRKVG